jgi:hypothetical protein
MDARSVASSSLSFPFVGILIISNGMFALLLWLWWHRAAKSIQLIAGARTLCAPKDAPK